MAIDGKSVATGRIERTVVATFPWVGSEVGKDIGEPLTGEYQAPFAFEGNIEKVEIDIARSD